jgi:hypothetical protein
VMSPVARLRGRFSCGVATCKHAFYPRGRCDPSLSGPRLLLAPSDMRQHGFRAGDWAEVWSINPQVGPKDSPG